MRHAAVRGLLYDYLTDVLPAAERMSVEWHCISCARCAAQREAMRQILTIHNLRETSPADERPEEFWDAFAQRVESSIATRGKPSRPAWADLIDDIERTIQIQWRTAAGFAGTLTIFAVAFALWKLAPPAPPADDHAESINVSSNNATLASARMNQYFRKSKVLFVGLTNMETQEGQHVDLTAERQASRELIREARYLRQQPLDTRSSELIDQLERILIELANMERQADLPNVEMIRSGIHRENLLFKIRMAQALYDPARNRQPSTTYQRTIP